MCKKTHHFELKERVNIITHFHCHHIQSFDLLLQKDRLCHSHSTKQDMVRIAHCLLFLDNCFCCIIQACNQQVIIFPTRIASQYLPHHLTIQDSVCQLLLTFSRTQNQLLNLSVNTYAVLIFPCPYHWSLTVLKTLLLLNQSFQGSNLLRFRFRSTFLYRCDLLFSSFYFLSFSKSAQVQVQVQVQVYVFVQVRPSFSFFLFPQLLQMICI